MSIIAAFISNRNGVVASDGREFGPVRFENGVAIEQAQVISEEFDKTFSIDKGRVIGAYCGLMSFAGMTIAGHITQIVGDMSQRVMDFPLIVEGIEIGMKIRLSQIDDDDAIFSCRKIDLLLVAGLHLTKERLYMASIRFMPVNEDIITDVSLLEAGPLKKYYVYGEDQARAAAANVFGKNCANNKDEKFLTKLAQDAVRAGIYAAGPHLYGPEKACGGKIFTKKTRY